MLGFMVITEKKIYIAIGVIGGIFIGCAAILGYMVWQSAQKVSEQEKASLQPKPAPQYDDRQKLIGDINQKYGSRDFQGAIKTIEAQKDSGTDPALQLLLAGAYANAGDTKKAFEIYKKLDADGKLPQQEYGNMADMAEKAGDIEASIRAYKKAKEYAISSKSESPDQIAVYDYKISELEKRR